MLNTKLPEWVYEILSEIEEDYDVYFYTDKVIFKKSRNYHGFHRPYREIICVCSPTTEKNDKLLLVLLHEIAHFIQHRLYNHTVSKRDSSRRRRTVHNLSFWKIVYSLYEKFNILEFAINNEPYKRGRKELRSLKISYNSNYQQYWPAELRIPELKNNNSNIKKDKNA